MDLKDLFSDKSTKPKAKVEILSAWLTENPQEIAALTEFAKTAKDPVKGSCIEAMEFVTQSNPSLATKAILEFVSASLTEKAPRIKWESAKVIGNIAHLFPDDLDNAIGNLLVNTEHEGTVVRWSAAFALGEILKLKTAHNKELVPAILNISEREEKNSIRKIYEKALKSVR